MFKVKDANGDHMVNLEAFREVLTSLLLLLLYSRYRS